MAAMLKLVSYGAAAVLALGIAPVASAVGAVPDA